MAVETKVSGFADMERRLRELPDKFAKRILAKAVRAGAVVIQKEVIALAPRGKGVLARNVVVRPSKKDFKTADSQFIVGVVHGRTAKVNAEGKVTVRNRWGKMVTRRATRREKAGEDPFYFRFQELGFRAVGTHRGGPGHKIAGRRFMTQALPRAASRAIEAVRATLAAAIEAGELNR